MLISHPRHLVLKRRAARLYVLRNNGYCWGRLIFDGGEEHDIVTRADLYDRQDEEALDALERKARRSGFEEPLIKGIVQ